MKSKIMIVARQELTQKFKSKVIIISALLLILLAGASPWIPHIFSEKTQNIRIAVLKEAHMRNMAIMQVATRNQSLSNLKITYRTLESREIALRALKDDRYSYFLDATSEKPRLIIGEKFSPVVRDYLIESVNQWSAERYLIEQGISVDSLNEYVKTNSISVFHIDGKLQNVDYSVALFALVLLYMILSLSGGLLALTIIEEKSGRIMEVLLSSISPKQLLQGKILGVMIFSVLQFLAITATWIVSSKLAHSSVVESVTFIQILFFLAWFVPALFSFSFIYGGLGALISKSEDSGAIQGPISLLLLASVYGATYSLSNSESAIVAVGSYLPPFSFFIVPAQYLSSGVVTEAMMIGYLITLISTVVVIRIAVSLFENNVLNNRRFSFKFRVRF